MSDTPKMTPEHIAALRKQVVSGKDLKLIFEVREFVAAHVASVERGGRPPLTSEDVARVFHEAKRAAFGPSADDAVREAWNAVAEYANRATVERGVRETPDAPTPLSRKIRDTAQAVYDLNAEQWPTSGDYVRTLMLNLCRDVCGNVHQLEVSAARSGYGRSSGESNG